MDWRRPGTGLAILAVASAAFIGTSLYAGLGLLSILGCVLMLAGFSAAMAGTRLEWLGVGGGTAVALGGLLFFVDNFLDPFTLGLSSVALFSFIAGGIALAYGAKWDPSWTWASGIAFVLAGALWVWSDGTSGATEWQFGNVLVLVGGLLLLSSRRRRPPRRPAPVDQPAPSAVAAPSRS